MSRLLLHAVCCSIFFSSPIVLAQSSRPSFTTSATIVRLNGLAKVTANDPRPMDQAIIGIREEYGLLVDYEDPIYQSADIVDSTDPVWREKHPEGRSVTRPRGGIFSTSYPEGVLTSTTGYEDLLRKITADYNQSGNVGQFKLVKENSSRFAVIPISKTPLDQAVQLPAGRSTLADAVLALSSEITRSSGIKVVVGLMPMNVALQSTYEDDGKSIIARDKLANILGSAQPQLVWRLLYDSDLNQYFLNYFVARLAWRNVNGEKLYMPLNLHK